MAVPSGPKGTRDFYPELQSIQEYLFDSWRKTCRRYSFEAYDGPMFEHLSIYTQKSGNEIHNAHNFVPPHTRNGCTRDVFLNHYTTFVAGRESGQIQMIG